mgnify:CR=1 FL=1
MDISQDRMNSIGYIKYQIEQLENLARYQAEKIGQLEEEVKRQDREIEQLKQLNGNDGK